MGALVTLLVFLFTAAGQSARAAEPAQSAGETAPAITAEALETVSFTDVTGSGPAQDAVRYVACLGLMEGTGAATFNPYGLISRATVAVLLQRLAEEPGEEAATVTDSGLPGDGTALHRHFTDVTEDAWYAAAVSWAAQAGIVTGSGDGSFSPNQQVTRAQLAVMLYRYAAYVGADTQTTGDLSAYDDGAGVASYAKEAVAWALEQGVFDPLVREDIDPLLPVTRLQLAQVLVALIAHTTGEPVAAEIASRDALEPVVSASRANHEAISAKIEQTAAKYGAIGIQVAVIEDGQITDAFATGWATRGSDPMTAYHKMRIASISKVVVGMEVMRLREKGVVNLDSSVGSYWGITTKNPYYPQYPVTLRSILSHTSSIANFGDNESRSYGSVRSRLAGSSGYSRLVPGSIYSWSYNNYAFSVLGMTAELAAGASMNSLLDRDFFNTMGIDAAFAAGDLKDSSDLVTLYYHGGSVARSTAAQRALHTADPGQSGTFFAGGLTISAMDMAKLVALLANDGSYEGVQLLQPATVALMEQYNEKVLSDGSYQALPLRYRKNIYGRSGLYYHTGSAYGVYNCISYDPTTGDGVVVLTVGASAAKDSQNIYAVCGEISSYIYGVTK
jgi:CubicO group peptidase (beta-lactamase class C family)